MNINDYKNIVIIIEPMMGCNHFANLIATSDQLQDRLIDSHTDYKNFLIDFYKKGYKNAHIMKGNSLGNLISPEFLHAVSAYQRPGVLNGHLGTLYGESGDLLRSLGRNLLLLGSAESANKHMQRRVSDKFLVNFLENSKKIKVSEGFSIHGILPQDIIEFDPNLLFSPNITPLLVNLDQQLNLDLDIAFCQQLHDLWFRNNF